MCLDLTKFWLFCWKRSGNCLLAVATPLSSTDNCMLSNKTLKGEMLHYHYVTIVWWKQSTKCQGISLTSNTLFANKYTHFQGGKEEKTSTQGPAHTNRCFQLAWLITPLLRCKLGEAMLEIIWCHGGAKPRVPIRNIQMQHDWQESEGTVSPSVHTHTVRRRRLNRRNKWKTWVGGAWLCKDITF